VLSCPLSEITLGDIYEALGAPPLLAVGHRTESPGCVVEQAVNSALDHAYRDAEALLMARLHEVTLAALSKDFHRRMVAGGHSLGDIAHAS
jgi:DNA-binding IscR family transcriptional regulator